MEEAPQGTFEDELDWCIHQLETGLLRQHPTPKQVSDSQRILRVLRSRKAPFVKKRQVMSQVFGNYRVKMAEERRAQENANNPQEVQIQEVTVRDSHSVVYRKCLTQGSSENLFTASNSNFSFNFCPDQTDQSEEGGTGDAEDKQTKEVKCVDLSGEDIALFSGKGSRFTFDFQIPEDAGSPSQGSEGHMTTLDTSGDQLDINQPSPAATEVAGTRESLSHNCPNPEGACSVPAATASQTVKLEAAGKKASDSPKKKKKKKSQAKTQSAQTQSKVEEQSADAGTSSSQQSGADELRRQLDWCVEQLGIGLQRKKCTPTQVEEALGALKTLRSEKVPLVKKRRLMRTMFGDYRRKMEEERLKQLKLMQAAAKSARVSEVAATARQNSCKVFRKSNAKSCKIIGQSNAISADSQGTSDPVTVPTTSNHEGFIFKPSQESFSFNFL